MRKRPVLCQTHALAIILCFFGQSIFGQPRSITEAQLVLSGGTIYVSPTENPVRDGVVVVRDGKIAAVGRRGSIQIPSGAQILDCSGLTIISGFWNSHVHFMERKWADAANIPAAELSGQLQAMLTQYGFTSVFDTGSMWENTRLLRDRIESGEIHGPKIRSTGEILYPKGAFSGTPPQLMDALGFMKVQYPEVADAPEALGASKKLLGWFRQLLSAHFGTFFFGPPERKLTSISSSSLSFAAVGCYFFAQPTALVVTFLRNQTAPNLPHPDRGLLLKRCQGWAFEPLRPKFLELVPEILISSRRQALAY